jgi:hypothetical protein
MGSRNRRQGAEHRGPRDPGRRFPKLRAAWSSWKRAVDRASEPERLRQAEQRRFAGERLVLDLETLWKLPAFSPNRPEASQGV